MANHMSAREAWEIVKGGNPMHRRYPEEWEVMRYARACAIVEACVEEHEAMCVWCNDASSSWNLVRYANEHVCALERGEEDK